MTIKIADSEGRVALGPQFANQTVIIEDVDATEVRVIVASVVPQRELWLHQNAEAKSLVLRGIAEAAAGKFSDSPPDIAAAEALAEKLSD